MKATEKTLVAREWSVAYDGVPELGLPSVTLHFVAYPGFWHCLFHETGSPPQSYCVTHPKGNMFAILGRLGLMAPNLSPISTEFILSAQAAAREAADFAFPAVSQLQIAVEWNVESVPCEGAWPDAVARAWPYD